MPTPPSRRFAASRCSSRASRRPRRRRQPPRHAKKGKLGKKVNPKNLAVFVRQFSVMIDAGLPLVQCLEILGNQEEDKNFAETILATRSDVESGASLADAMKKHPKAFDPLFTNMIAAGEAGGILDTILKRLATYIEKAVKLKGAGEVGDDLSRSPSSSSPWSSSASFCGRSFRRSRRLFAGLGAQLPLPTRIVIALSNFLVSFMPFIIVGIGAVGLRVQVVLRDGRRASTRLTASR